MTEAKKLKTPQEKEEIKKEKEITKATADIIGEKEQKCTQSFVEVKKLTGEVVRVYTVKDHGNKFVELAKEFAKKNAYVAVIK